MSAINCYIPLKLQVRGELSEREWATLEERLTTLYVQTIERSLSELARARLLTRQEATEQSANGSPNRP